MAALHDDLRGSSPTGQIILMLSNGDSVSEVSRTVGIERPHVYKWARRFIVRGIQGLVDKLHSQKGITITQKIMTGANHFFSNDAELLISECSDYLDRRLAGELADPRPKRLR